MLQLQQVLKTRDQEKTDFNYLLDIEFPEYKQFFQQLKVIKKKKTQNGF